MAGTTEEFVECPKRDAHEMCLISPQIIHVSLCMKRQGEHFHKCPKCLHRSELVEVGATAERELVRI